MFCSVESLDKKLKKELTKKKKDFQSGQTSDYLCYLKQDGRYLLPRQFFLSKVSNRDLFEDEFFIGKKIKSKVPKDFELRPYQKSFVSQILADEDPHKVFDNLIQADTGMGKTVMAIYLALKMRMTTLIVVDQTNIGNQWLNSLQTLFQIDSNRIGWVGGGREDYLDKDFVIATVQTLSKKKFNEDFYSYFGTCIYDEAHTTASAETYIYTLYFNHCKNRMMVSATFDDKEYLAQAQALRMHCGEVKYKLSKKHSESKLSVYDTGATYQSDSLSSLHTEIALDTSRNLAIANIVKELYESGHKVLVLSHSTIHLSTINTILVMLGVEISDIGYCAKSEKFLKREDEFYEVKVRHHKDVNLEKVMKKTPIVLSSFRYFSKGTDLPELSAGVDCVPYSSARQTHGRILRQLEGKKTPHWVTIRDSGTLLCEEMFSKRLTEYKKSNASEVYKWLDETSLKVEYDSLKQEVASSISRLR